MRFRSSIVISLLLIARTGLVASAAAEDAPSDFARPGFYVRAGASLGFERSQMLEDINAILPAAINAVGIPGAPPGTTVTAARLDAGTMVGVSVGLGQRVHPRLAIEAAFVPRFGGGVDIYITRNVLLNVDGAYLLSTGDLEENDIIALRLGLGLRF